MWLLRRAVFALNHFTPRAFNAAMFLAQGAISIYALVCAPVCARSFGSTRKFKPWGRMLFALCLVPLTL